MRGSQNVFAEGVFPCYRGVMRLSIVGLVLSAVAMLGCSSVGGGMPAGQAQVTVKDVILPQIEAKAEEVFHRHGFDFKGAWNGRMEFERDGGTLDNVLYGNWQRKDTITRVTLFITSKEPGVYTLRTRSEVVRNSFGGESDTKLFDVQGGRYKAILNKIVRELREETGG